MMKNLLTKGAISGAAIMALCGFSAKAETEFPAYDINPDLLVREQPAGELRLYERSGADYRAYLGGVDDGSQDGMKMEVVFDEDGETVWFYNIISTAQDCFTWIKGTLADGVVTIPEGTPAYAYDFVTYIQAYILCNLSPNEDCDYGTTDMFDCIPGDIRFAYDGETFTLLPNESGVAAIGLQRYTTDPFILEYAPELNYKWLGYGDEDTSYIPFDMTPNTGPSEDAEINKYVFKYRPAPGYDFNEYLVDIALEDSRMYMRGIGMDTGNDLWTVADFDGEKAVFPGVQYIGEVKEGYETFYTFIRAAKPVNGKYIEWVDQVDFDFDPETGVFTSEGSLAMAAGNINPYVVLFWTDMSLTPYLNEARTPASPVILDDFELDDYYGWMISADIPCVDVNGNYIDPESLSYEVYINGKLFTFNPDEYYIEEPMTEVPYYFTAYGIEVESLTTRVFSFFDSEKPESFGIRSICTIDGVVMKSDLVTNGESSVSVISDSAEIESVKFFTTSGTPADENSKGIVIKRITYTDGSVKTSKIVNR